jgi:hypothetical protein
MKMIRILLFFTVLVFGINIQLKATELIEVLSEEGTALTENEQKSQLGTPFTQTIFHTAASKAPAIIDERVFSGAQLPLADDSCPLLLGGLLYCMFRLRTIVKFFPVRKYFLQCLRRSSCN